MFRLFSMLIVVSCLPQLSFGELITLNNGTSNLINTNLSDDYIEIRDNATLGPTTVIISDGAVVGTSTDGGDNSIKVFGSSVAELQGGVLLDDALATESSRISVRGGTVGDDLQSLDSSMVEVFGGTVADETQSNNVSTISIFGGSFADDIESYDTSTINIHGGIAGEDVEAFDNSHISIWGGSFGQGDLVTNGIGALESGTITLYGSKFFIDDIAVTDSGAIGVLSGTLTGTLADGSVLDTPFVRSSTGQINLEITAIPEPSASLLLFASTVGWLGRRRR